MSERPGETQKLKVFISYSRRDLAFVDQLVAVLEWRGFLPVIDRKGIHGAERWEERLGQLILESDIVVFVLSPDSAASEVCAWEVEQAVGRGKRIIPILCAPLEGHLPHPQLRDLNYIYFYEEKNAPGSGFGTGQVRLIDALSIDIIWLREHTRLEEMAARWHANERPEDQLVRGSELARTKVWREARPVNAAQPTPLQRAFLDASEAAEVVSEGTERKRLAEIAAAQEERAKALQESEIAQRERAATAQRLARRTMIGSVAFAAMIFIAGGAFGFVVQYPTYFNRQTDLELDGSWCIEIASSGAKPSDKRIFGTAQINQKRGSAAPEVSGKFQCVSEGNATCYFETLASNISERQLIFVYLSFTGNDAAPGSKVSGAQRGVAAGKLAEAKPSSFSVGYSDLFEETADRDIKGQLHFSRKDANVASYPRS